MAYVTLNGINIPALVVSENRDATQVLVFNKGVSTRINSPKSWAGTIISSYGVADKLLLVFDCTTQQGEVKDFLLGDNTIIRVEIGNTTRNSTVKIIYNNVETYSEIVYDSSAYGHYFAIVPYVINPSINATNYELGFSFIGLNDASQSNTSLGEFLLNCDAVINSCVGLLNNDSIIDGAVFVGDGRISACLFRTFRGFSYTEYPDSYNSDIETGNEDPYNPGGFTEPGGGTGTFDEQSDPVEIPSLPALSASDTGLITLFNPSLSQLQQLASYLWSDLFDVTAWKKIFADPMDAILGLSIVPVAVPNTGASPIKVGNIATDVSANKATSQFVEVDCGSVDVTEYWGAYLDYDPYTKVELYLPYIGVHPLTTDDVMGKSVRVVYHVDVLSGACCAYVKCGSSVLYSFVGQCSCSIPITGSDWTNVINGAINIAASIGSMVATGGATAPMAVTDIASTAVNSMKPTVEKSGSISGTGGLMGIQTPYLILTRPRQAIPENQNRYSGYPSFITRKLADLSGYTEIESIHLENIPATEQELSEIESLLKGGVLL